MQRDKPSLIQIQAFLAIIDHGSFRRAANITGVTQPTLTAHVAALEKLIGARLFERSRGGTKPTPLGRSLVAGARRVVEEVDGFIDNATVQGNGPGGTFRFGVTPTLGPYVLPHILPGIQERYPNLRLYIREAVPRQLERELIDGQQDLILTALPVTSKDLSVYTLLREPVKLVLRTDHALAQKSLLTAEDLRGADVLALEEHHLFHRQVEQLCDRFGAKMVRDYEGTSLDTLRHMVVMGMGIAFLPELYVLSEIREEARLRVTEIYGQPVYRVHALAWRTRSPARQFFLQLRADIQVILARQFPEMLLSE